jgi:hypothetical protein
MPNSESIKPGNSEQDSQPTLFGLAAEFDSPEQIVAAAARIRADGYTCAEAYTPFPVTGLSEELGFRRTRIPIIVLCGAICGAAGGFFMQWFANVVHLPWNIGGRPVNSWPAFIPITFECAILLASLSGVFGMLFLNRLPTLFHPIFNTPDFERASRDRFFLCIESEDPLFDLRGTRKLLEELRPMAIMEVPR